MIDIKLPTVSRDRVLMLTQSTATAISVRNTGRQSTVESLIQFHVTRHFKFEEGWETMKLNES